MTFAVRHILAVAATAVALMLGACGESKPSLYRLQDGVLVETTSRWSNVQLLADTGLYADFANRRLAAGVNLYRPAFDLWSDGLDKARYISLPPGAQIDTTNMDGWQFPVGTKAWKEFAKLDSATGTRRLIETRMLEKAADGAWIYASYQWNAEQTSAVLADVYGVYGAADIGSGVTHDIPPMTDCQYCHENSATSVLGFGAVQLATENLLFAGKVLSSSDVTTERLASEHTLSTPLPHAPMLVQGANPLEKEVVGYLHGNCGHCHNPLSHIGFIGLRYQYSLATRERSDLPILLDINRQVDTPGITIPGVFTTDHKVIDLDEPDHSMILFRMSGAESPDKMPRLASKIRDQAFIAKLRDWIVSLRAP